jgi:hypothetical protein
MPSYEAKQRLQEAGLSAYRVAILTGALVIVLGMFVGMAYLVSNGRMSAGPLVLFAGVILGYILRSLRAVV